jgi:hypothetical protein
MPALRDLDTAVPDQRQGSPAVPSVPPAPPVRETVVEPCACGHGRAAHDHYRSGTDCGACGATECGGFRPQGGPIRRALRRLGVAG